MVVEFPDGTGASDYLWVPLLADGHPKPPFNGSRMVFDGVHWMVPVSAEQTATLAAHAARRTDFGPQPTSLMRCRTAFDSLNTADGACNCQAIPYRFDAAGNLQWVACADGSGNPLPPPPETVVAIVPFSAPIDPLVGFGRSCSYFLLPATVTYDLLINTPYALGYCLYNGLFDPGKLVRI